MLRQFFDDIFGLAQVRPRDPRWQLLTLEERRVLTAAPRTQKQLHAANERARAKGTPAPFPHVPSTRCPWCDMGVEEDHRHLYW